MYKNAKIFILGMARSGYEVAKYLSRFNNEITIVDAKSQEESKVEELQNLGVNVVISSNSSDYLDETYQVLIKNPGIKYSHETLVKAKKLNIPIVNEVEVASYFFPKNLKVVGVTGSNGKTTTTNLIYEIIKESGRKVIMAGNMGIPVCSILDDLETISEKIIIKNPIIGYFKTYNADNFVDKMIKADLDVSNTLCDIKSKDLRYIVANIGSNIRGAFSYLTLNIPRNGETEISVVNSDKIAFYIFTNSTIIDKSSEVLKVVDYRGDVVREANYSYVERLNKELEFNFVNWDVNRKL